VLDRELEWSGSPGDGTGVLVVTDDDPDPALLDALRERGLSARIERIGPRGDPSTIAARARPSAVILEGGCATARAWQLARAIRDAVHSEDVPILAYRMDPARGRTALFELAHLVKPVQVSDLARALSSGARPDGATGGRTILVVDDDPATRELHARVAQEAGARVVVAADGVEALAALETSIPDLVMLDLAMPRMDGFAVLEAMRARPSTRDVPVVVVTGQVLTDEDLARLDRGVATILDKGIHTAAETVARIESAIALNRCRIAAAKALLDATDLSITAVAMRVGFSEVSHFTRTFHREVGVSPRAYRSGQRPSRGIRQEHPVERQDHPSPGA
jgi:CheY-like chemotaxis protein